MQNMTKPLGPGCMPTLSLSTRADAPLLLIKKHGSGQKKFFLIKTCKMKFLNVIKSSQLYSLVIHPNGMRRKMEADYLANYYFTGIMWWYDTRLR